MELNVNDSLMLAYTRLNPARGKNGEKGNEKTHYDTKRNMYHIWNSI